jgi:N6-L-threonylcarbamoyladenine synthase
MSFLVLGIESSCDDTAIAIIDAKKRVTLSHIISSQIEEHRPYGGVVPEIAARSHVTIIDSLIEEALVQANVSIKDIDLLAATGGPGLIGGVITSVMIAKGISISHNIPLCFVNHLEGHALVPRFEYKELEYPFLLFLASGGHCQVLICEGVGKYQKLGQTLDDAIGEAFDKVAKVLGLPYPGGPEIEKLAKKGDERKYDFPISMKNRDNCDFSLSGLKTAVRYKIEKLSELSEQDICDIGASFQYAVSEQILSRLERAIKIYKEKHQNTKHNIVFSGGVAANSYLNDKIKNLSNKHNCKLFSPSQKLCTDNGVMIAWAGYENFKAGNISDLDFKPKSRWNLV